MSDIANDLRGRAKPAEVKFGAMGKIIGAVVVLVLIGAVGTYTYKTMPPPHAKPAVSNSDLPTTGR
jgi:hypothetical protein